MSQTAVANARKAEVVLFHSALGLRPSVRRWADRLRTLGMVVHTPDLLDGRVFDDHDEATTYLNGLGGIETWIARTIDAVASLPNTLIYAGFSNGAGSAQLLAATRNGALGAVLMHGALPLHAIGVERWPASVPVQLHYGIEDPWRDHASVDALRDAVRRSGAPFEGFDYPVAAHLFADDDRAEEFDARSAELMFERVSAFLGRIALATVSNASTG